MRALQIVNQEPPRDPLSERASALWPESTDLQRRWMRAVQIVRNTRRGWLLERPVRRVEA